jgi:hypothetical protein
MKKQIRHILTIALLSGAFTVKAQTAEDFAALQKQLNELSAKVAQLEKQQAEKIAAVEQQYAERIAVLEQQSGERFTKLETDNTVRIAKLEADTAKNKIPAWVNDTKFKGDFRYRYENIASDSVNTRDQDRQRVRLRIGANGKVNDFTDYGVRLATGGSSATSSEQDVDGGTKKEIRLDQYFVDMHQDQLMGTHLIMGKMPQPWIDRTGLIWDSDVNPEGLAATYETGFTNGLKLMANAGSFVIKEDTSDDLQLWAGQVAGETKVGGATIRLGASDFYYQRADDQGAGVTTTGANTPGTGFNLVEGFGSVGFDPGIPVVLNGQYVVNVDATSSDDTAYLFGVTVGKAKDKGSWEAGYNYRDTGVDAVPDGYNDSTFAGGFAGSHGHSFWAKYQLAKNIQGGLTYLMAVDNTGGDVDTLQAELTFKF